MLRNVSDVFGINFTELDNGILNIQCLSALQLLAKDGDHYEKLKEDFL